MPPVLSSSSFPPWHLPNLKSSSCSVLSFSPFLLSSPITNHQPLTNLAEPSSTLPSFRLETSLDHSLYPQSSNTPLANHFLNMGMINRPPIHLNARPLPTPPRDLKHEVSELSASECPRPGKKQRNTYEKLTPLYRRQDECGNQAEGELVPGHPRGLSPELLEKQDEPKCNAHFKDLAACSPDLLMKDWEEKLVAQTKDLVLEAVSLDTEYKGGFDCLQKMGHGVMESLKQYQEWYRKKDQHIIFKNRAKKLLDKNWEIEWKAMLHSLEDTLRCRNCNEYHSQETFIKKCNALKARLEDIDSSTVDQALLDRIKDEAWKMGGEHLAMVNGSRCQGMKTVWRRKTVGQTRSRDRADSGVDLSNEPAALETEYLCRASGQKNFD
jgi:hypothetical protein